VPYTDAQHGLDDGVMPQYKSAARLLEIVEGNVLKLCLYSLQNKCVTQELEKLHKHCFVFLL
jgi:hypothetical protein